MSDWKMQSVKSEIIILKEEIRLETLRATKQNLDDYFEDELRVVNCDQQECEK